MTRQEQIEVHSFMVCSKHYCIDTIMAQALILGFLVLCSFCLPLLSAQDCPSSFHCGRFGVIYFPFTNTTNPECGFHCGRFGVLDKLKGNGEEFINEVATISQTSHVNVVSLYGFCFQGSKRALVYEFMPNGSLEKFIYEHNAVVVDHQLDCKTLHAIAIGTARGLEYLHRGCNTRILHFDIKPHNILLDVDFSPKISDFGLAKICPKKESIVSMLGARGTAGYIAPEVFSRNFGGVSHKSDVYSFGMMVLEMVGGRKNINVEVECSSEIYFPHWIYKSLEKNQELALRCVKNENDNEVVRKMILVSLWCIQTDPSARPAMSQVVDMLEGSLESLQIPPKPFLSSPRASPIHYSTSNLESASVIVNL